MKLRDRLFIDKEKEKFIRGLTSGDNQYLNFEESKHSFIYAASLGKRNPIKFKNKDGLVLEQYLDSSFDIPIIYALALNQLSSVEQLANKDLVYSKVEEMANRGYIDIEQTIKNSNPETIDLISLRSLDEKYEELKEEGYL